MFVDPAGVNHITNQIIGGGIRIHRKFGPGLLESTYEACLVVELQRADLRVERQVAVPVTYDGIRLDVGYRIDLLVEGRIVVEVKAVESLVPVHRAQVLTYLKLKECPVGLILNFNVPVLRDGIVRIVNPSLTHRLESFDQKPER